MSDPEVVAVPPEAAGDRLDTFLQAHAADAERSRSEWHRLIARGAVELNGQSAKPGQRVNAGDRIAIAATAHPGQLAPEDDVPFEVVYADSAMIVVNKPAGVVVHPAPGNERGTLVNGLLARFPELRGDDPDELRPGIVHRIDKDTSGLLVVGRTLAATADLQQQMQQRTTEKRYTVLVRGNLDEDEGLIDRPIARDPRQRQRMAVRQLGRESQTHFWVRERFGEFTLLEVLLLTGRTHQIRVHFASIGHPVAGDDTYGPTRHPLPWLARQFLHACFLRLRSPADGAERTFTAPLPADLEHALDRLRRRGMRAAAGKTVNV